VVGDFRHVDIRLLEQQVSCVGVVFGLRSSAVRDDVVSQPRRMGHTRCCELKKKLEGWPSAHPLNREVKKSRKEIR
jgi:hypothetical protein